jgi:integrase
MARYKIADKPNQEIEVEDFKTKLEASHLSLQYKAYAILVYWTGCRRSELLDFDEEKYKPKKPLRKESIKEADGSLLITNLVAKKKGWRTETIGLPLSLYGMDIVKEAWQKTKPKKLIFPFCDKTGYRIIKQLYPDKYPHWFRYNRATKIRRLIDGKTFSLDDAKAFTGIKSDRTMQTYGMTTNEGAKRVGDALARM